MDPCTAELEHLARAVEIVNGLTKDEDALWTELKHLQKAYKIGDELAKKHSLIDPELEHLAQAFEVHASLDEAQKRRLETTELDRLVKAAKIQDELLKKEKQANWTCEPSQVIGRAAMDELEHLVKAVHIARNLGKNEDALWDELKNLERAYQVSESLGRKHRVPAADLEHLEQGSKVVASLTETDRRALERDELSRLVRAAEVQDMLTRRERASLTGRRCIDAASKSELDHLVKAAKIAENLNKKEDALWGELKHMEKAVRISQNLSRTHDAIPSELQQLADAYAVYDKLCEAEKRKLEQEELDRLVVAARIDQEMVKKEKAAQELIAKEDDERVTEALEFLARAAATMNGLNKNDDDADNKAAWGELKRMERAYKITNMLGMRHGLSDQDFEHVTRAYELHKKLIEEEARKLEDTELDRLVNLAKLQQALIGKEQKAIKKGLKSEKSCLVM